MKNYSITIVLGFFCLLKATAQNPGFYQVHPDNSAINWYFQLNRDPVIIQNGEVTSEQNLPDWYHALQFLLCPGVLETVEEAYGYFTSNLMFIDAAGNAYEDRNRPDQQQYYIQDDVLERSRSYRTNEEARTDTNVYVLAGCYEVVVFGEVYLQYHYCEILFLYLSNMFLTGMDVNSAADIQRTINVLTKNGYDYNSIPHDYDMGLAYFLKENGVWKNVNYDKMDAFLKANIPTLEFMQENGTSVVHIESTVDTSGNRVYFKHVN